MARRGVRLGSGVAVVLACGAAEPPIESREAPVVPPCPTTGLISGRVPVFPGASVHVVSATTRGHMDTTKFAGRAPASFAVVLGFYAACLGTWPEIVGASGAFARQYDGDWKPGKGRLRVDSPEQMSDRVVVKDHGEWTGLEIVVVHPYGPGRAPIAEAPPER